MCADRLVHLPVRYSMYTKDRAYFVYERTRVYAGANACMLTNKSRQLNVDLIPSSWSGFDPFLIYYIDLYRPYLFHTGILLILRFLRG